jgi:hypothetical protein
MRHEAVGKGQQEAGEHESSASAERLELDHASVPSPRLRLRSTRRLPRLRNKTVSVHTETLAHARFLRHPDLAVVRGLPLTFRTGDSILRH